MKTQKLKLASADFTFPLLPHDNVLDLIAALEMDGIDIGLFEGRSHLWPSKEFKNLAKSAKTLSNKLSDLGLKAADVFLQMNPDFVPYAINHTQSRVGGKRKARHIPSHARICKSARRSACDHAARRAV